MDQYEVYRLEGSIKAWKELIKESDAKIKKYSAHEHNADLLELEKDHRKFLLEKLEKDEKLKAVEGFKQASKELYED